MIAKEKTLSSFIKLSQLCMNISVENLVVDIGA